MNLVGGRANAHAESLFPHRVRRLGRRLCHTAARRRRRADLPAGMRSRSPAADRSGEAALDPQHFRTPQGGTHPFWCWDDSWDNTSTRGVTPLLTRTSAMVRTPDSNSCFTGFGHECPQSLTADQPALASRIPTAARTVTLLRPERCDQLLFGRQPTARSEPLFKDLRFQQFCQLDSRRHTSAGYPQISRIEVEPNVVSCGRHRPTIQELGAS